MYLYDLPKENITSVKLANLFKETAGIELE